MNDNNLQECLTTLFNSLAEEEETKSLKLVAESLTKLNQFKIDFSNPEKFNLFLVYKLNNGLEAIANTFHSAPQAGIEDTYKPNFIYLHYAFLEHNIRELCTLREGSSCWADKSRAILNMYLKYSLTAEIPEFNPDLEPTTYQNSELTNSGSTYATDYIPYIMGKPKNISKPTTP